MIAVGMVATLMNTYGAMKLLILENIMLLINIVGFYCIVITLWVLSPEAPASEVFGSFSNFEVGLSSGQHALLGKLLRQLRLLALMLRYIWRKKRKMLANLSLR